jgi:hypothetical protein
MSTDWTTPSNVTQYAEDESHIAWHEVDNFNGAKVPDGKFVSLSKPLLHIARQPRNDVTMKTYFMRLTEFNFQNIPETISGIECKLTMNRSGRVADDTVQLCYQGELIGENQAGLHLNPIQVYGNNTSLWKAENLTLGMVQDPSFGVVVRFRSHPHWPHKSTPLIDSVELQIY